MKRLLLGLIIGASIFLGSLTGHSPVNADKLSQTLWLGGVCGTANVSTYDEKLYAQPYNFGWGNTLQCTTSVDRLLNYVYLQYFDWSTNTWRDYSPTYIGGGVVYGTWYLHVHDANVHVDPYLGVNCRRVRVTNYVSHPSVKVWDSYSPGQCY